jgi:hypothetical protein
VEFDADAAKVWLIIGIVSGPLLTLLLPHAIRSFIISLYVGVPVLVAALGRPERPWKYG